MSDTEKELAEITARAKEKAKSIMDFLWLVVLAFLIIGSFTSMQEQATVGLIVFTMVRIFVGVLTEGVTATKALFFSKKSDSNDTSNNANKEQ